MPYNIVPDIFLLFCATCILYSIVIFNIIKVPISNFSERRCNMSDESKVSKAQQKAVAKYMKNNYDEIKVRVEKGKREIIKAAAEQAGESLNGYIKKAVDQRMERDNA